MKARLLAVLILLGFGAARLSFEEKLTREHRAAFFHGAKLDLELRQQLGQMGFLAALSGFRAVVADVLWIQAHSAWERTEWGRMKLLFDAVTALQPRAVLFWDNAAWHMAWNASVAAFEDRTQPREVLRIKAQREYFKIGEDFLLRGIQNNPERPVLYDRLAMLYRSKMNDHEKSAAAYQKCSQLPGAPEYAKRFAAYELAQVPGKEQEAYERLLSFYNLGQKEQLPTLVRLLRELEEKLNVPSGQRIKSPSAPSTP
jgi:hypothetical protein